MSAVIKLLEEMGRDPAAPAGPETLSLLSTLDTRTRASLLRRDPAALAAALDAMPVLACMILTPENDEPAQEPQREDDPESPDAEPQPE